MQKQIDSGYYDDMFKNATVVGVAMVEAVRRYREERWRRYQGGKPYGDLHLSNSAIAAV